MNEFFMWNMRHSRPWDKQPRLTEDEQDELFALMNDEAIPAEAMSTEMADGYMTACIVGPDRLPVHDWLEAIFAQPTLPLPHDPVRQQRLLTLLLHRYQDIDVGTSVTASDITPDNMFVPLTAEVPDEDRITPYQLDENGERLGRWDLQDWGEGFRTAASEGDAWDALISSREMSSLLAPSVMYTMGYNPDHLEYQIDEDQGLLPWLVVSLLGMRTWWRNYNRALTASAIPLVRDAPKLGRNDPCPCGSGKKYKKCCGAG